MKITWKTRVAAAGSVAALAVLGWTAVAQAAPTPTPTPTAATSATADATLTRQLTKLRQEEQLARDVYTALAAKYDQAAPFVNIARSEQWHYETVGVLLTRYGIADPTAGRAAGSFADADLQKLYDSLIASGSASLSGGYDAGIAIEKADLADLKATIASTSATDVKAALTNLQAATENHLAVFTAAKDGKQLGTGYGQGMRNGRGMWNSGTATPAAGVGMGQGMGQGRGPNGARPANCPLS